MELLAPLTKLGVGLCEHLPDQSPQGLSQRGVRNVALELIELSCCEEPPRRNKHPVQLVHEGRLSDAWMARNQHQPRTSCSDHLFERGEQLTRLALPAVQSLRQEEAIGAVSLAQRELVDGAARLPLAQAASEIVLDPGGALVSLVGCLREQLHDD